MKRMLCVTGAAAALLCLTGAGTATAAHQPAAGALGKRVGEVIKCDAVNDDLPNALGHTCDSTIWGPLSNFTLVDRSSDKTYACRSGWAEGSLWVSGQGCRALPK